MMRKVPEWLAIVLVGGALLAGFLYERATGTPIWANGGRSVYIGGGVLVALWLLVILARVAAHMSSRRLRDILIQQGKWDPIKGPLTPMSDAMRDRLLEYERKYGTERSEPSKRESA